MTGSCNKASAPFTLGDQAPSTPFLSSFRNKLFKGQRSKAALRSFTLECWLNHLYIMHLTSCSGLICMCVRIRVSSYSKFSMSLFFSKYIISGNLKLLSPLKGLHNTHGKMLCEEFTVVLFPTLTFDLMNLLLSRSRVSQALPQDGEAERNQGTESIHSWTLKAIV